MTPTLNISGAVSAVAIADWHVNNLEVQLGRPEQQVEIAEGVELPEIISVGRDGLIILPPHYFGAAQRIFDGLAQEPGKGQTEKLIAQQVEETHRLFLHRVNQARTVGKVSLP